MLLTNLLPYIRTVLIACKEAHVQKTYRMERQRWTQKRKGTSPIRAWDHSNSWLLSWHPGQPENEYQHWGTWLMVMCFCRIGISKIAEWIAWVQSRLPENEEKLHAVYEWKVVSSVSFFVGNQICSNVTKRVYKAREGRSTTVAKLRCCLVEIPDSLRTNPSNGVHRFWLCASAAPESLKSPSGSPECSLPCQNTRRGCTQATSGK